MATTTTMENDSAYMEYVATVLKSVNERFENTAPQVKAVILQAAVTPKFFWEQAQEAEKMTDEIGHLADDLITGLKGKKLSRPVYGLLSRAVFKVTPGKNLAAMDYAAPDFRATIIKALKNVDYSGLTYTNILKLLE